MEIHGGLRCGYRFVTFCSNVALASNSTLISATSLAHGHAMMGVVRMLSVKVWDLIILQKFHCDQSWLFIRLNLLISSDLFFELPILALFSLIANNWISRNLFFFRIVCSVLVIFGYRITLLWILKQPKKLRSLAQGDLEFDSCKKILYRKKSSGSMKAYFWSWSQPTARCLSLVLLFHYTKWYFHEKIISCKNALIMWAFVNCSNRTDNGFVFFSWFRYFL